mmetsp:Transcript_20731/g.49289  ORF Transcript_20731/g.49289 Transcript_20731/m.49289 type:complete len:218 (-) Transcript_20731:13-666(-)
MPHQQTPSICRRDWYVPEAITEVVLRKVRARLHHAPRLPHARQVERRGLVEQVRAVLVVLACAPLLQALVHDQPRVHHTIALQLVDHLVGHVLARAHREGSVSLGRTRLGSSRSGQPAQLLVLALKAERRMLRRPIRPLHRDPARLVGYARRPALLCAFTVMAQRQPAAQARSPRHCTGKVWRLHRSVCPARWGPRCLGDATGEVVTLRHDARSCLK